MAVFLFYVHSTFVHIAVALAVALPASAVFAAATLSLSLPSQPLATSLNQLARQANVQLIAAPASLANKTAPAVKGSMTLNSALGQLLAGSGLEWTQMVTPSPSRLRQ
ncbi:STN domain-containing protein (plasmid) [Pseudomonas silvicola]|nr:STN domain-containing protein [Pseudomonas silvicola]